MNNAERDKKIREARELYVRGMSVQSISKVVEITSETINRWKRDQNWDAERKMRQVSTSELKSTIMETFIDMKEGRKPLHRPDDLAKLVAAFERLSEKKKTLGYTYEILEALTAEISEDVIATKVVKTKEFKLQALKYIRSIMDKLTIRMYNEALNE